MKTNVVHLVRPELPDAENWLSAQRQWKFDGTNIVEWSQEEIDAEAATNAVQQLAAQREGEKTLVDLGALRATVKVIIDEINLLRGRENFLHGQLKLASTNQSAFASATNRSVLHGLNEFTDRTAAQARTAIKGEIDEQ